MLNQKLEITIEYAKTFESFQWMPIQDKVFSFFFFYSIRTCNKMKIISYRSLTIFYILIIFLLQVLLLRDVVFVLILLETAYKRSISKSTSVLNHRNQRERQ